ncbi:Pre-mRNA-splicing factor cwf18-like protein [Elsinoe fawcettii]|nr:Pre-mRNA-splicing factor cwf18-like protein [Elsinoe fawcettii]
MSTTALSAASSDRKARLAQLKSLKRKEPPSDGPQDATDNDAPTSPRPAKSPRTTPPPPATTHLSGRNYDPLTRGPKLGFETAPTSDVTTLEARAQALSSEAKAAQEAEKQANLEGQEAPLDLFKLQPKKPNWDLKRELDRRMQPLEVRTENAIARLVRDRVEGQKRAAKEQGRTNGAGAKGEGVDGAEEVGMEGSTLVEATKEREREDEEESRREREMEEELEAP